MRDSVELEWAGIPSVCIVHGALAGSAQAMARLSGHETYEFLVVDSSYDRDAKWTPDELREIVQELAPKVRALLTRRPIQPAGE
jgi:hypothetical protein